MVSLWARSHVDAREDSPTSHRVELAVRSSEARLQALLRSVSDVIAILAADGTIRYVSPAAERAWGCSADELLGSNVLDRTYAEDCATAIQLLERTSVSDRATRWWVSCVYSTNPRAGVTSR
jgi:PAS domain-containing protein